VLQGSVLGPLLFLIYTYINDLSATINSQSKPILFADDTSIIIAHPELVYLQNIMNDVFTNPNKWFKANKLALNFDKTNYIKFGTKNKTCPSLNIGVDNKLIEEVEANKFLGLQTDNNLNLKEHIEYIIPKLSYACFAMRTVVPLMTIDTFKISLLRSLPLCTVIRINLLENFNRQ
jgi:hypothetical protein